MPWCTVHITLLQYMLHKHILMIFLVDINIYFSLVCGTGLISLILRGVPQLPDLQVQLFCLFVCFFFYLRMTSCSFLFATIRYFHHLYDPKCVVNHFKTHSFIQMNYLYSHPSLSQFQFRRNRL